MTSHRPAASIALTGWLLLPLVLALGVSGRTAAQSDSHPPKGQPVLVDRHQLPKSQAEFQAVGNFNLGNLGPEGESKAREKINDCTKANGFDLVCDPDSSRNPNFCRSVFTLLLPSQALGLQEGNPNQRLRISLSYRFETDPTAPEIKFSLLFIAIESRRLSGRYRAASETLKNVAYNFVLDLGEEIEKKKPCLRRPRI